MWGGALVYFYDVDYHTTDLDVFNISYGYGSLTTNVLENIRKVGKDNGVGSDWINDAVSLPDFQEKDSFNIKDMIRFLDKEKSIWIYDDQDNPKINLIPVSFCGVITAKLIAGRAKDFNFLAKLFRQLNITNEKELEKLFYQYNTFVNSDKYYFALENAKIIFDSFEQDG